MKKGFSKQITKKRNQMLNSGTSEDGKKINNYITVNLRGADSSNFKESERIGESKETAKPLKDSRRNDETSSDKSSDKEKVIFKFLIVNIGFKVWDLWKFKRKNMKN